MTTELPVTVLLSYDGSADAQAAIVRAARILPGAAVTVLTVWEPLAEMLGRTGSLTGGLGSTGTYPEMRQSDAADHEVALAIAREGAERATTLGLVAQPRCESFSGLLDDLEHGYTRTVAFVVPDGNSWPLPLYELALMTAEEAWSMNVDRVELHLVTPETEPLGVFGAQASAAVAELLTAARVTTHLRAHARMPHSGILETATGEEIAVDRVVALPVLEGRRLDGIPSDAHGFILVDDAGVVDGLHDVYAVGDATDRPIKQGGLACQQADIAAAHIAARAGADVEVPPLQQVLRGRLLTGGRDRYLRNDPAEAAQKASAEPLWWPPAKVSGKYLSPYLAAKDLVHLPAHAGPPVTGVDVHVEVGCQRLVPGGLIRADPLRPITPLHVGLRG